MNDKYGSGLDLLKHRLWLESSYKSNNDDFKEIMSEGRRRQLFGVYIKIIKYLKLSFKLGLKFIK
jgi:hypothetical protein